MRLAIFTLQISHYHHARFDHLWRRGTDFHVVSTANEGRFEAFVSTHRPAYPVARLFASRRDYEAATVRGDISTRVDRVLDTIRPEIVAVAGWALPESFAALRWARQNGAATIIMSDSHKDDAPRKSHREWIKSRVIAYGDAGFVAGRLAEAYLSDLGMEPHRITLGYDSIDTAHFRCGAMHARRNAEAVREWYGLPAQYILAAGRFVPKKNFARLIAAFDALLATCPDAPDLVIVGGGPLRDDLERARSDTRRPEKIHLPGIVGYAHLPAYYGLAEAFIHPAIHEQWGMVLAEAAASGLRLGASPKCGATPELIKPGQNGVTFDTTSTEEMTAALRQLISWPADRRHAAQQQSEELASRWAPETFARGLLDAASLARQHRDACEPRRTVGLLDQAIFRALSTKTIERVR